MSRRNSIAGMTISIHPEYPEFLTAVWFSFPAVGLAFPMYMGGVKTPLPLLEGTIYELGAGLPDNFEVWEKIEVELMMKAAALEDQAEKLIREGRIAEVRELIDEWSGKTTEAHLAILKSGRVEAD